MPTEYWIILGLCVAVMALAAWYLGDEDKRIRGMARVGVVLGGTGVFVSTIYYGAIFVAVLVLCLPVMLLIAWWNGLWS